MTGITIYLSPALVAQMGEKAAMEAARRAYAPLSKIEHYQAALRDIEAHRAALAGQQEGE